MQIRKAALPDVEGILQLYQEQFQTMAQLQPYFMQDGEQQRPFVETMIARPESAFLLALEGEEIKGFVLLQEKETPNFSFFVPHRYGYLMDIIVEKDSRGQGFGSALLRAAKDWALERRLEYLELDVLSNNHGAEQLYARQGFQEKRRVMFCPLEESACLHQ